MDYNDLYQELEIEKDLTTGFTILFSRFEYALKRTPRYALGDDKGVKADWDRFARDYNGDFNSESTPALKAAVQYLKDPPPRKQIIKNGSLDWKDVLIENTPLLKQVLDSVRRVRNNLFHGGKFPDGPVEDPGRDNQLLESCTTVLEECISLDQEVHDYFYGYKP